MSEIKKVFGIFSVFAAVVVICVAVCVCDGIGHNIAACSFADMSDAMDSAEFVEYDGAVEHIFTHELVYDTDKAFASNNPLRHCFDKDHLTAREFAALLDSLYSRGYVLVRLDDVLSDKPLLVPRGKKPLVMSFDDMTYDTSGRGCIDRLVLSDGEVWDYTRGAEPELTRERENVTILENFIARNPDFSHNGGRATLCVNGYNGILGYRFTPDCKVSDQVIAQEREQAVELVNDLKKRGYSFASHTYYHKYFNGMSAAQIEKDCKKWREYIQPIVGETRILCYPAGEHNAKSAKNDIFKKYGFDVFLCVGSYNGTDYERNSSDARYIYRKPFDGTALRLYGKLYAHLADTEAIYDTRRFRPFTYKGSYS